MICFPSVLIKLCHTLKANTGLDIKTNPGSLRDLRQHNLYIVMYVNCLLQLHLHLVHMDDITPIV